MPELPEVEVVRRGLDTWAAGRLIERVEVHDPRSLRRHFPGPQDFTDRLRGQRLQAPQRRGKFLWVPLAPAQYALMIHLGMSGQVLMQSASTPVEKHLKVTLELEDAPASPSAGEGLQVRCESDAQVLGTLAGAAPGQLRFVDQRIFGGHATLRDGPSPGRAARTGSGCAHCSGSVGGCGD